MAPGNVDEQQASRSLTVGVRRAIQWLFGTSDAARSEPEDGNLSLPQSEDSQEEALQHRAEPAEPPPGEAAVEDAGVTPEESAELLGGAADAEVAAEGAPTSEPVAEPAARLEGPPAAAGMEAEATGQAEAGAAESGLAETDGGESGQVDAGQETPRAVSRRGMFRTKVDLPANLEISEKEVPVRIENISGSGAAIIYDSADPLPGEEAWLDLALPNRPKPLELEVRVVRTRQFTNSQGKQQQMLHVTFPSIRRGEQDNIIAYINNIRIYEGKQYTVAAIVKMEVVTGRRRFAKFTGQTMDIRPDKMKLMMDDFDAIAGSEVMLTIMAPHFADHIDVDDVMIEKVDVVGPRKAEVEVSIKKPDDKVLLFIRKHYPAGGSRRQ